jgi:hypothetical protein
MPFSHIFLHFPFLSDPSSVRLAGPDEGLNFLELHSYTKLQIKHFLRNAVFWDVTQCGALILVTRMMQALRSSETSFLTRATHRNIPEDDILHSHRRENLKSYTALTGWIL